MREKSGKRRREEGRKVPLLGPIKKPVSASVSESLLRHSRQLRKHLKAPEKPDNTSLVECRVPPGGHCDFAPCHRDTDLLRASMCRNIATILCIKHRPPSPPSRGGGQLRANRHPSIPCNPFRTIFECYPSWRCHISTYEREKKGLDQIILWFLLFSLLLLVEFQWFWGMRIFWNVIFFFFPFLKDYIRRSRLCRCRCSL